MGLGLGLGQGYLQTEFTLAKRQLAICKLYPILLGPGPGLELGLG